MNAFFPPFFLPRETVRSVISSAAYADHGLFFFSGLSGKTPRVPLVELGWQVCRAVVCRAVCTILQPGLLNSIESDPRALSNHDWLWWLGRIPHISCVSMHQALERSRQSMQIVDKLQALERPEHIPPTNQHVRWDMAPQVLLFGVSREVPKRALN